MAEVRGGSLSIWERLRDLLVTPGLYYGVLAFAAAAAALLARLVDLPPSSATQWLALIGVLIAVAVPPGLAFAKESHERAEDEWRQSEAEELVAVLHSYLGPALESLRDMLATADPNRRAGLLGSIKQTVTNAAQEICGPKDADVRAVLFNAVGYTLKQEHWHGGRGGTSREFRNNVADPAGKAAWALAADGEPHIFYDVAEEAPEGLAPGERRYETFITCGILDSQKKVVGMLNVDAPEAYSLTDRDCVIVGILARVLAAAYQCQ